MSWDRNPVWVRNGSISGPLRKEIMSGQSHRFPQPFTALQSTISLSLDVSGVPAVAVAPDGTLYFAAAMKGYMDTSQFAPSLVTTATSNSGYKYNIIVGNYTSQGIPTPNLSFGAFQSLAYSFYNTAMIDDSTTLLDSNVPYPSVNTLWSGVDDSNPSLAVGSTQEIYIAYVTTGSVYNRYNMETVPTFCACAHPGPRDIVVARILNLNSQAVAGGPGSTSLPRATYAQWRIQDATINSCNDETNPHLAIDNRNQFLYMVHQTSGQILCYPVIGSAPNIILSCFATGTGQVVWREAQGRLNAATGGTTNPAIAVDGEGGIYVAMEVTGAVSGGADLSGATQRVELVKFSQISTAPGVFASEQRQWILSALPGGDLWPGSGKTCREPTVAYSAGQIMLAFVTDGVMPGQVRSVAAAAWDLVVVFVRASGIIVHQGGSLNPAGIHYLSAHTPYATADSYGNFYLTANVDTAEGGNVYLYKLRYGDSMSEWNYTVGVSTFGAYAIAGNNHPNSMFPTDIPGTMTPGTYSQTPVAVAGGTVVTATVTNNLQDVTPMESEFGGSNGMAVGFYREALYYLNDTAYTYMATIKSICACGKTNCGC